MDFTPYWTGYNCNRPIEQQLTMEQFYELFQPYVNRYGADNPSVPYWRVVARAWGILMDETNQTNWSQHARTTEEQQSPAN